MLVPRSHGGLELGLPAALEIIVALSKIDGSVGWTVAIGSGGDLFAPLLPRDTYEEIDRSGPDAVIAGSAQPAGTAEAAAGGSTDGGRSPAAASMPTGKSCAPAVGLRVADCYPRSSASWT
jgi:alkylation response protein AidB-like acyl-CoA dehydrogenase